MTDEQLRRHIRVLESQVEGNKEVVAALRELEENLVVRIDDSASETSAMVEIALTRIDELRGILHRLEDKIDALASLSLNGDHSDHSDGAARSPGYATPSSSSETGPSCAEHVFVMVQGKLKGNEITECGLVAQVKVKPATVVAEAATVG
jgi:hypothetical protein